MEGERHVATCMDANTYAPYQLQTRFPHFPYDDVCLDDR